MAGAALLLAACSSQPVEEPGDDPFACSEPRPQVCTMIYAPVCATLKAGGEADYSSPCNACADDAVESYREGRCDAEDPAL
jgi:hypothetical protein